MGIAVSDELGMIALPLEFIPAEPFAEFLARLRKLLAEKEAALVLVGMPRNMDGSYGPAAVKVQAFVAVLREAIAVPIRTWDERLTSVQAHRFLREAKVKGKARRERVDASAAAVLLQSYLDATGTA
jgi:putative Holliday junction resolvase